MVNAVDEDHTQRWQRVIESNCVWIIEDVGYYPLHGSILADGRLKVSTAGQADDGERWDGSAVITEDHPHYLLWRQIIENKEEIRQIFKEKENQQRAERRQKAREQRKTIPE